MAAQCTTPLSRLSVDDMIIAYTVSCSYNTICLDISFANIPQVEAIRSTHGTDLSLRRRQPITQDPHITSLRNSPDAAGTASYRGCNRNNGDAGQSWRSIHKM